MDNHARISVLNVFATSAGSILACAVMLSASVAIANPNVIFAVGKKRAGSSQASARPITILSPAGAAPPVPTNAILGIPRGSRTARWDYG